MLKNFILEIISILLGDLKKKFRKYLELRLRHLKQIANTSMRMLSCPLLMSSIIGMGRFRVTGIVQIILELGSANKRRISETNFLLNNSILPKL